MRILITSDTHGQLSKFWDVFKKMQQIDPIDVIVHCGDYYKDAENIRRKCRLPVLAVKGNCDGDFRYGGYMHFETEAGNFLITHGHMLDVGHDLQRIYYKVLEENCIGAFFGHTHRSVYLDMDGIYLMNPGSLSRPRDGSGGTFGIIQTCPSGVWGKIYRYSDFMQSSDDEKRNDNKDNYNKKTVIPGGKLRKLFNYSDRF